MRAPAIREPKGWQERIQLRLWDAEMHEENCHFKTDYRQAFVCVSLAFRGNAEPFASSSYALHGCHPDQVWPRIVANRKDKLGPEYSRRYGPDDMPLPDRVVADWDYSVGPPPPMPQCENPEQARRAAYRRTLAESAQSRFLEKKPA